MTIGLTGIILFVFYSLVIPDKREWPSADKNTNPQPEVQGPRIQLCDERRLALNALANLSAVPPSTLKSIINGDSRNPGIVTIKLLCDGLGISLYDFFNDDVFKSSEPETI